MVLLNRGATTRFPGVVDRKERIGDRTLGDRRPQTTGPLSLRMALRTCSQVPLDVLSKVLESIRTLIVSPICDNLTSFLTMKYTFIIQNIGKYGQSCVLDAMTGSHNRIMVNYIRKNRHKTIFKAVTSS